MKRDYEELLNLPVYPAFVATFGGLMELVNWLWVAKGADMNVMDYAGRPLLNYAIVSRNTELVEVMITMGADINLTAKGDDIALTTAVTSNKPKISIHSSGSRSRSGHQ